MIELRISVNLEGPLGSKLETVMELLTKHLTAITSLQPKKRPPDPTPVNLCCVQIEKLLRDKAQHASWIRQRTKKYRGDVLDRAMKVMLKDGRLVKEKGPRGGEVYRLT